MEDNNSMPRTRKRKLLSMSILIILIIITLVLILILYELHKKNLEKCDGKADCANQRECYQATKEYQFVKRFPELGNRSCKPFHPRAFVF